MGAAQIIVMRSESCKSFTSAYNSNKVTIIIIITVIPTIILFWRPAKLITNRDYNLTDSIGPRANSNTNDSLIAIENPIMWNISRKSTMRSKLIKNFFNFSCRNHRPREIRRTQMELKNIATTQASFGACPESRTKRFILFSGGGIVKVS